MTKPEADRDEPGDAAWHAIEPYCESVGIYNGPQVFVDSFEKVPEPARRLFAVWFCDAEVCNGGFHQFFFNSTGVLAPEAAEGFRAAGLTELAELLETAIARLGEPYPRDRAKRLAVLETLKRPGTKREECDPFYELDDRYYEAKDRLDFDRVLDDYARRSAR